MVLFFTIFLYFTFYVSSCIFRVYYITGVRIKSRGNGRWYKVHNMQRFSNKKYSTACDGDEGSGG